MTNIKPQKKLASRILGCGVNRVRVDPSKIKHVERALTGSDIRTLINNKVIWAKKKKGVSKARSKK